MKIDSQNKSIKLAGVCGWPIHHSLSPALHNFWLKKLSIYGTYVPFAVHPDEAVEAFRTLKNMSIQGVNVTLPLKAFAFEAADEYSSNAQKLGVANCLYRRGTQLVADNTDLEGFMSPMVKHIDLEHIRTHPVFVIGAGNVTRAVIMGLIELGATEIYLSARRLKKAQTLADSFALPHVHIVGWNQRQTLLKKTKLIINASSGGMVGKDDLDIDLTEMNPQSWVYDLVYTPFKTSLVQQAEQLGLNIIHGLDMLVAQARPSFKHFYGQMPPAEADPKPLLLKHLQR